MRLETWTLLAADINDKAPTVEPFHMKCQCQVTKIRWQDHIRNTEVLNRSQLSVWFNHLPPAFNLVFLYALSVRFCCWYGPRCLIQNEWMNEWWTARLAEVAPAHQAMAYCPITWSFSWSTLEMLPRPSPNQTAWSQLRCDKRTTFHLLIYGNEGDVSYLLGVNDDDGSWRSVSSHIPELAL